MEWERAKSLLILFFIALNIVLAGFLFLENRRYTLRSENERVIRSVLAQHDVSLSADMIRRFAPMRALRVSGYYYNEDELLAIFFQNPEAVTRTDAVLGGAEFYKDASQLVINNGLITYFNPYGLHVTVEEFISRHFPNFQRDAFFNPQDEEGVRITYRQVYRGYVLYSNFIEFLVTDAGIIEVDMRFGIVQGWDGPARPLFGPDEILITFLQVYRQRIQPFRDDRHTVIWHMDIVYFHEFENTSDERDSTHLTMPFYRIFVEGLDLPFLINAYMNVSIDV
ncbi:MAG: hypothetical protein FWC16_02200 [Defluviitaleaceae bacterium]|nr:hypothetical protein [Defluviitaleaceae bacterium]MCL2273711.1 hypothetical protein [Defluviitaleaceae bacterium]